MPLSVFSECWHCWRAVIENPNRFDLKIHEKIMQVNYFGVLAWVEFWEKPCQAICDNPNDFDTSTIDAIEISILPDNGRHSHGHEITKGSYSVSFEPFSL